MNVNVFLTNENAFWNHSAVKLDNFLVIFGALHRPSNHVIWMYNLYTEEWREHVIPKHVIDKSGAPEPFHSAVAVAINGTIYTFGGTAKGRCAGSVRERNALWTLSKAKTGCFTWNFIKFKHDKESPSPRTWHTGWEYAGKLFVFGGGGPSPERYLNDHGDIARDDGFTMNNQLLCYNPTIQKWTNPQCLGAVPTPRFNHASTIIKHRVWVYGGCDQNWALHDDIFEFTMHSLTWTHIETGEPCPQGRKWFAFTALANNQLVLHGGHIGLFSGGTLSDTWIFNLTSYTWRKYETRKDQTRRGHTASVCLNNNVVIIGGRQGARNCLERSDEYLNESYEHVFHVMLEAKSLQQLAARTLYKHQDEINWNCLPNKLISLLGLSIEETDSHAPPGSESLHSQSAL